MYCGAVGKLTNQNPAVCKAGSPHTEQTGDSNQWGGYNLHFEVKYMLYVVLVRYLRKPATGIQANVTVTLSF